MIDIIKKLFVKKSKIQEIHEIINESEDLNQEALEGESYIKNILNAVELTAQDVCVPKGNVISVSSEATYEEITKIISITPKSRYPVYEDNKDNIIGFIHIKSVLTYPNKSPKTKKFELKKFVKPVIYAAFSMPALELLKQMLSNNVHIAILIDEYGAFDGIITLTDLLSEIIGEIGDDFSIHQVNEIQIVNDDVIICEGATKLEKIDALWNIKLDESRDDDILTLGGLIFALNGELPRKDSIIIDEINQVKFIILDANDRKITKVRIEKIYS